MSLYTADGVPVTNFTTQLLPSLPKKACGQKLKKPVAAKKKDFPASPNGAFK